MNGSVLCSLRKTRKFLNSDFQADVLWKSWNMEMESILFHL